MKPSEFLTLLWGARPPGFMQLWHLTGKRSYYLRNPDQADYYADAQVDVYTAIGLAHQDHGRGARAKADQIIAIAGLWLDIDVNGGPNDKTGAAPSTAAALELAHAIATPTIVVHSGYGLHAWFLFEQPWRLASYDEQDRAALASAQWYALHRAVATKAGYGLDGTHDLARLLRLPGTLNGKGGANVPVDVAEQNGARYPREQLLELAARAGDVQVVARPQLSFDATATGDEALAGVAVGDRIAALIANDETFRDTWRCQRLDAAGWSMSEYNLSLATQLVAGGWSDPDIAEAIRLHRLRHDAGDTKGRRADYLARTITRARTETQRPATGSTAAEQLRALAGHGGRGV